MLDVSKCSLALSSFVRWYTCQPLKTKAYDDDEKARGTGQVGKILGLSSDNDEDMIDSLAADHLEKEEGTKCTRARAKEGMKEF